MWPWLFTKCNAPSGKTIKPMESDLIKHYRTLLLLIILLPLTILGVESVNAVTITDTYISGYGIASGTNEGYKTHFQFENYCPMCGYHGTLTWNPKGTKEGEITCSHCDCDYSVSGKEKMYNPRAWLTPYYPEPEPVVAENATSANIAQVQLTPLQIAHQVFRNNSIL